MRRCTSLLVALWTLVGGRSHAATLDGPAILDRVRSALVVAGNHRASFELEVHTALWSALRSGRIYKESGPEGRNTLIVFDEPAQVSDMKILSRRPTDSGAQTWLYVPAAHRARRIASGENGRSLFGASFSASDLEHRGAGVSSVLRGVETRNGSDCWVVEVLGSEDGIEVHEMLWVRRADFRVVRREFHERDGLRRVYEAKVIEVVDGVPTPLVMTITDVESGSRSEVRMREVRYRVPFDPSIFTVQRLDSRIVSLEPVPDLQSAARR